MAKTRVLFVGEAVSAARLGYMLTLARSLDQTRFTPLLAWHPRFNSLLGLLEFPLFTLPCMEPAEYYRRLSSLRPVYDEDTLERYVAWELEVFREASPHVVVSDPHPSLMTSTSLVRLPYVNVVSAHLSPYARWGGSTQGLPWRRRLEQSVNGAVFRMALPVLTWAHVRNLNAVRSRFGCGALKGDVRGLYSRADMTVFPDIPEVTPLARLPPTHRFIGPVVWGAPVAAPEVDPPDGRPLVYVDLAPAGSNAVLDNVLEALTRLSARAVVAASSHAQFPPRNGIRFADVLPVPAAVPGVDVVVAGGGQGTVWPALAAGIPVVGIPSNIDQRLFMGHIQRAGLGFAVPAGEATPHAVERAVRGVLGNPGFRERARRLAERMAGADQGAAFGSILEEVLKSAPIPLLPVTSTPVRTSGEGRPVNAVEARTLVGAAVLAPSAGNSQPLRYRFSSEGLDILVDPFRYNRLMDISNSDLWMALGAALVNMEAAAGREGKGIWTELFPMDGRDGLLAHVRLTNTPGPSADLWKALGDRCTNRRAYQRAALPPEVLGELNRWAEMPGVRLDWIIEPEQLSQAASASAFFEGLVMRNASVGRTILRWLRPTRALSVSTSDGFGVGALELSPLDRFLFRLALRPMVRRFMSPFSAPFAEKKSAHLAGRSAGLGVLTVEDWRPETMVRGGQAFERLWLAATRRGVSLHPLFGIGQLEMHFRLGVADWLSSRERRCAEEACNVFARIAPAFRARVPLMLFRVGYADPPSERSCRLPLSRVYEGRLT